MSKAKGEDIFVVTNTLFFVVIVTVVKVVLSTIRDDYNLFY